MDWNWSAARAFLPFDLDAEAVDSGALVRRRGVPGGEALVRTLLLVALPGSSLARASAMAWAAGFAKMNPTALFNRLRRSERLLKSLFLHTLSQAPVEAQGLWNGLRLLAVDATFLCGPGAKGTDQKLHTVYDLSRGSPRSVDLTDVKGGETLRRHASFGFGDLLLCDSGYGYNRSFHWALRSGARFLIRFEFQSVKLYDEKGERIWPEGANAKIPSTGSVELRVEMENWPAPLRAVGALNPDGEPVWLLTDLAPEELPKDEVYPLYRKRWQVELYFKRLKSLLDLDALPTRDGPTARPWIWAKLVLASLAALLAHGRFSPCGPGAGQAAPGALEDFRPRRHGARQSPAGARPRKEEGQAKRKTKAKGKDPQTTLPLEA